MKVSMIVNLMIINQKVSNLKVLLNLKVIIKVVLWMNYKQSITSIKKLHRRIRLSILINRKIFLIRDLQSLQDKDRIIWLNIVCQQLPDQGKTIIFYSKHIYQVAVIMIN